MCLDRVTNHDLPLISRVLGARRRRDRSTVRTGYKVFTVIDGSLYFPYQRADFLDPRVGEWMVAVPRELESDAHQRYESGFHIFEEPPVCFFGSKYYAVRRVEYRDVVCTGEDDGQRTIVAREMRVLPVDEVA